MKDSSRKVALRLTILLAVVCGLCDAHAQQIEPQFELQAVASHEQLRAVNQMVADDVPLPQVFDRGWWRSMVIQPLRNDAPPLNLSLEQVLISALDNSQQIKVFSELPLIRETAIVEADAAFDWYAFIDSRWDDISDPIGNSLTAGPGVNRYSDHDATASVGLRKRTYSGGQLEIAQRLGFQETNSTFFVPNPQGSARISLNFTQPLLRGRGKHYNTSLTVLAEIDKKVADSEFRRQIESHLLEVSRAYWALYLERAVLYQKVNSFVRGQQVVDRLQKRADIDAPINQIVSAVAALRQRQSELMRARAAVRNSESRLCSLVNDCSYTDMELIPTDAPIFAAVTADLNESVSVAFQHRPEVEQALKQIKAASVRMQMSKHELLPVLNLVTEVYSAGLEDNGAAFDAFGDQFSRSTPSYAVGLQFEVPINNRAAKSRHQRRLLELRQMQQQFGTALETVRLEVETSVRELHTSLKELSTKQTAMVARQMHLDAITKRWERLPGEDLTASLALENMLIAQERLAAAEFEYLQSQLTYNLAMVNLKRATGMLLQHEHVEIGRAHVDGVPQHVLQKPEIATGQPRVNFAPPSLVTSQKMPGPSRHPAPR